MNASLRSGGRLRFSDSFRYDENPVLVAGDQGSYCPVLAGWNNSSEETLAKLHRRAKVGNVNEPVFSAYSIDDGGHLPLVVGWFLSDHNALFLKERSKID